MCPRGKLRIQKCWTIFNFFFTTTTQAHVFANVFAKTKISSKQFLPVNCSYGAQKGSKILWYCPFNSNWKSRQPQSSVDINVSILQPSLICQIFSNFNLKLQWICQILSGGLGFQISSHENNSQFRHPACAGNWYALMYIYLDIPDDDSWCYWADGSAHIVWANGNFDRKIFKKNYFREICTASSRKRKIDFLVPSIGDRWLSSFF